MDLSTAITLFLKQSLRVQGLPFTVVRDVPNVSTAAALAEYDEMTKDPEKYKRYDSFDALLEDALKDA